MVDRTNREDYANWIRVLNKRRKDAAEEVREHPKDRDLQRKYRRAASEYGRANLDFMRREGYGTVDLSKPPVLFRPKVSVPSVPGTQPPVPKSLFTPTKLLGDSESSISRQTKLDDLIDSNTMLTPERMDSLNKDDFVYLMKGLIMNKSLPAFPTDEDHKTREAALANLSVANKFGRKKGYLADNSEFIKWWDTLSKDQKRPVNDVSSIFDPTDLYKYGVITAYPPTPTTPHAALFGSDLDYLGGARGAAQSAHGVSVASVSSRDISDSAAGTYTHEALAHLGFLDYDKYNSAFDKKNEYDMLDSRLDDMVSVEDNLLAKKWDGEVVSKAKKGMIEWRLKSIRGHIEKNSKYLDELDPTEDMVESDAAAKSLAYRKPAKFGEAISSHLQGYSPTVRPIEVFSNSLSTDKPDFPLSLYDYHTDPVIYPKLKEFTETDPILNNRFGSTNYTKGLHSFVNAVDSSDMSSAYVISKLMRRSVGAEEPLIKGKDFSQEATLDPFYGPVIFPKGVSDEEFQRSIEQSQPGPTPKFPTIQENMNLGRVYAQMSTDTATDATFSTPVLDETFTMPDGYPEAWKEGSVDRREGVLGKVSGVVQAWRQMMDNSAKSFFDEQYTPKSPFTAMAEGYFGTTATGETVPDITGESYYAPDELMAHVYNAMAIPPIPAAVATTGAMAGVPAAMRIGSLATMIGSTRMPIIGGSLREALGFMTSEPSGQIPTLPNIRQSATGATGASSLSQAFQPYISLYNNIKDFLGLNNYSQQYKDYLKEPGSFDPTALFKSLGHDTHPKEALAKTVQLDPSTYLDLVFRNIKTPDFEVGGLAWHGVDKGGNTRYGSYTPYSRYPYGIDPADMEEVFRNWAHENRHLAVMMQDPAALQKDYEKAKAVAPEMVDAVENEFQSYRDRGNLYQGDKYLKGKPDYIDEVMAYLIEDALMEEPDTQESSALITDVFAPTIEAMKNRLEVAHRKGGIPKSVQPTYKYVMARLNRRVTDAYLTKFDKEGDEPITKDLPIEAVTTKPQVTEKQLVDLRKKLDLSTLSDKELDARIQAVREGRLELGLADNLLITPRPKGEEQLASLQDEQQFEREDMIYGLPREGFKNVGDNLIAKFSTESDRKRMGSHAAGVKPGKETQMLLTTRAARLPKFGSKLGVGTVLPSQINLEEMAHAVTTGDEVLGEQVPEMARQILSDNQDFARWFTKFFPAYKGRMAADEVVGKYIAYKLSAGEQLPEYLKPVQEQMRGLAKELSNIATTRTERSVVSRINRMAEGRSGKGDLRPIPGTLPDDIRSVFFNAKPMDMDGRGGGGFAEPTSSGVAGTFTFDARGKLTGFQPASSTPLPEGLLASLKDKSPIEVERAIESLQRAPQPQDFGEVDPYSIIPESTEIGRQASVLPSEPGAMDLNVSRDADTGAGTLSDLIRDTIQNKVDNTRSQLVAVGDFIKTAAEVYNNIGSAASEAVQSYINGWTSTKDIAPIGVELKDLDLVSEATQKAHSEVSSVFDKKAMLEKESAVDRSDYVSSIARSGQWEREIKLQEEKALAERQRKQSKLKQEGLEKQSKEKRLRDEQRRQAPLSYPTISLASTAANDMRTLLGRPIGQIGSDLFIFTGGKSSVGGQASFDTPEIGYNYERVDPSVVIEENVHQVTASMTAKRLQALLDIFSPAQLKKIKAARSKGPYKDMSKYTALSEYVAAGYQLFPSRASENPTYRDILGSAKARIERSLQNPEMGDFPIVQDMSRKAVEDLKVILGGNKDMGAVAHGDSERHGTGLASGIPGSDDYSELVKELDRIDTDLEKAEADYTAEVERLDAVYQEASTKRDKAFDEWVNSPVGISDEPFKAEDERDRTEAEFQRVAKEVSKSKKELISKKFDRRKSLNERKHLVQTKMIKIELAKLNALVAEREIDTSGPRVFPSGSNYVFTEPTEQLPPESSAHKRPRSYFEADWDSWQWHQWATRHRARGKSVKDLELEQRVEGVLSPDQFSKFLFDHIFIKSQHERRGKTYPDYGLKSWEHWQKDKTRLPYRDSSPNVIDRAGSKIKDMFSGFGTDRSEPTIPENSPLRRVIPKLRSYFNSLEGKTLPKKIGSVVKQFKGLFPEIDVPGTALPEAPPEIIPETVPEKVSDIIPAEPLNKRVRRFMKNLIPSFPEIDVPVSSEISNETTTKPRDVTTDQTKRNIRERVGDLTERLFSGSYPDVDIPDTRVTGTVIKRTAGEKVNTTLGKVGDAMGDIEKRVGSGMAGVAMIASMLVHSGKQYSGEGGDNYVAGVTGAVGNTASVLSGFGKGSQFVEKGLDMKKWTGAAKLLKTPLKFGGGSIVAGILAAITDRIFSGLGADPLVNDFSGSMGQFVGDNLDFLKPVADTSVGKGATWLGKGGLTIADKLGGLIFGSLGSVVGGITDLIPNTGTAGLLSKMPKDMLNAMNLGLGFGIESISGQESGVTDVASSHQLKSIIDEAFAAKYGKKALRSTQGPEGMVNRFKDLADTLTGTNYFGHSKDVDENIRKYKEFYKEALPKALVGDFSSIFTVKPKEISGRSTLTHLESARETGDIQLEEYRRMQKSAMKQMGLGSNMADLDAILEEAGLFVPEAPTTPKYKWGLPDKGPEGEQVEQSPELERIARAYGKKGFWRNLYEAFTKSKQVEWTAPLHKEIERSVNETGVEQAIKKRVRGGIPDYGITQDFVPDYGQYEMPIGVRSTEVVPPRPKPRYYNWGQPSDDLGIRPDAVIDTGQYEMPIDEQGIKKPLPMSGFDIADRFKNRFPIRMFENIFDEPKYYPDLASYFPQFPISLTDKPQSFGKDFFTNIDIPQVSPGKPGAGLPSSPDIAGLFPTFDIPNMFDRESLVQASREERQKVIDEQWAKLDRKRLSPAMESYYQVKKAEEANIPVKPGKLMSKDAWIAQEMEIATREGGPEPTVEEMNAGYEAYKAAHVKKQEEYDKAVAQQQAKTSAQPDGARQPSKEAKDAGAKPDTKSGTGKVIDVRVVNWPVSLGGEGIDKVAGGKYTVGDRSRLAAQAAAAGGKGSVITNKDLVPYTGGVRGGTAAAGYRDGPPMKGDPGIYYKGGTGPAPAYDWRVHFGAHYGEPGMSPEDRKAYISYAKGESAIGDIPSIKELTENIKKLKEEYAALNKSDPYYQKKEKTLRGAIERAETKKQGEVAKVEPTLDALIRSERYRKMKKLIDEGKTPQEAQDEANKYMQEEEFKRQKEKTGKSGKAFYNTIPVSFEEATQAHKLWSELKARELSSGKSVTFRTNPETGKREEVVTKDESLSLSEEERARMQGAKATIDRYRSQAGAVTGGSGTGQANGAVDAQGKPIKIGSDDPRVHNQPGSPDTTRMQFPKDVIKVAVVNWPGIFGETYGQVNRQGGIGGGQAGSSGGRTGGRGTGSAPSPRVPGGSPDIHIPDLFPNRPGSGPGGTSKGECYTKKSVRSGGCLPGFDYVYTKVSCDTPGSIKYDGRPGLFFDSAGQARAYGVSMCGGGSSPSISDPPDKKPPAPKKPMHEMEIFPEDTGWPRPPEVPTGSMFPGDMVPDISPSIYPETQMVPGDLPSLSILADDLLAGELKGLDPDAVHDNPLLRYQNEMVYEYWRNKMQSLDEVLHDDPTVYALPDISPSIYPETQMGADAILPRDIKKAKAIRAAQEVAKLTGGIEGPDKTMIPDESKNTQVEFDKWLEMSKPPEAIKAMPIEEATKAGLTYAMLTEASFTGDTPARRRAAEAKMKPDYSTQYNDPLYHKQMVPGSFDVPVPDLAWDMASLEDLRRYEEKVKTFSREVKGTKSGQSRFMSTQLANNIAQKGKGDAWMDMIDAMDSIKPDFTTQYDDPLYHRQMFPGDFNTPGIGPAPKKPMQEMKILPGDIEQPRPPEAPTGPMFPGDMVPDISPSIYPETQMVPDVAVPEKQKDPNDPFGRNKPGYRPGIDGPALPGGLLWWPGKSEEYKPESPAMPIPSSSEVTSGALAEMDTYDPESPQSYQSSYVSGGSSYVGSSVGSSAGGVKGPGEDKKAEGLPVNVTNWPDSLSREKESNTEIKLEELALKLDALQQAVVETSTATRESGTNTVTAITGLGESLTTKTAEKETSKDGATAAPIDGAAIGTSIAEGIKTGLDGFKLPVDSTSLKVDVSGFGAVVDQRVTDRVNSEMTAANKKIDSWSEQIQKLNKEIAELTKSIPDSAKQASAESERKVDSIGNIVQSMQKYITDQIEVLNNRIAQARLSGPPSSNA
jgi:hypothetical protein